MSLNAIFDPMVRSYFDDGDSGGGLTVIELETSLTDGNNTLSDADIAKLTPAMDAKIPVAISFPFNEESKFSLVFVYFSIDNSETFFASVQGREFFIMRMAGMWMVTVQTAE